jgi:hypothetical protein
MSQGQTDSFDNFDFDDVDPDAPGSFGGGSRLPEGGYKFAITEVVVQTDKGSTQIECEVVQAKDEKLIGRKHMEFLSWPATGNGEVRNRICKEHLLAWCYAAKTTNAEEIKARQQARQGFNPAWLEAMVGREVLGFVKVESYTGKDGSDKTSAKCEGRVWALDNPKGKGIPGWLDTGKGPAAAPASASPAPVAAAPVSADPFAGLV